MSKAKEIITYLQDAISSDDQMVIRHVSPSCFVLYRRDEPLLQFTVVVARLPKPIMDPETVDRRRLSRWGGVKRCTKVKLRANGDAKLCGNRPSPGSDYCWKHGGRITGLGEWLRMDNGEWYLVRDTNATAWVTRYAGQWRWKAGGVVGLMPTVKQAKLYCERVLQDLEKTKPADAETGD